MNEELKAALISYAGMLGTIVGIVLTVVKAFRKQRADAMAKADKPTVPVLPPPSPELLELNERLRAIEREQDITRLRLKYDDSVKERHELRLEAEALQSALTTERRYNELLRAELEQARHELAQASMHPTPMRPPRG